MGKREGTAVTTKTQEFWAGTTRVLRQKRTIWLAAMLAFFAPSVAAAAWYAGSVNVSSTGSNPASFSHDSASVTADTGSQTTSNQEGTPDSSASASVSTDQNGQVKTDVVINGKKVEVPNGGSVQSTTYGNDGSTSNVSVSVNSSQNSNTSSNGFSSTNIHTNSSTHSNSQNSNSSTSFNSHIHSSTP